MPQENQENQPTPSDASEQTNANSASTPPQGSKRRRRLGGQNVREA